MARAERGARRKRSDLDVLATFFGSDNIPFTTTSEDLPGLSRTFASFSEAAAEAGMSRIYGGIHFMSANQEGLRSGAQLGQFVMESFLKQSTALQTVGMPARDSGFDTTREASQNLAEAIGLSRNGN